MQDALFPLPNERGLDDWLSQALSEALQTVSMGSAMPDSDPDSWRPALARQDFETPTEPTRAMQWVIDTLTTGLVQPTHPGYLGLFNPAPTYAAECADRIAAAFNPQICVYSHAPAAVDIEQHVIRQMALRIGLPEGSSGHFTSGGSEANLTSVLCALASANPGFRQLGARAYDAQPTLYVSRESHLAWLKIAQSVGIGRQAVRLVDTDGAGRMDMQALAKTIDTDRQSGCMPVMVAATAGTTNAGMIDPLHECRELASHEALWLHVDAAWGGALAASPTLRSALDGIELADSVTIDAHKWFATTMGAGMFLTRNPTLLGQIFDVATDYMPAGDSPDDLYINSMQWSRRFIGIRLYLTLTIAGWQGIAQHVEHSVDLCRQLSDQLIANGWAQMNDSPMAVACLQPPGGGERVTDIVNAVQQDGRFWCSETRYERTPVLRACITNGRTDAQHINALVDLLRTLV